MIDYSLLPYEPNKENMAGVKYTDVRGGAVAGKQNRLPAKEEIAHALKDSEYLIRKSEEEGENLLFEIKDVFDPGPVLIRLTLSKDNMWLNQSDLFPAFEISRLICKAAGPMFFGVNGFDHVYLIDNNSDFRNIRENIVDEGRKEYKDFISENGWPAQIDAFASPEIVAGNKYLQAQKLVADLAAQKLGALGYKRFSSHFYSRPGDKLKVISLFQIHYCSMKTAFLSGHVGVSNVGYLERAGLKIPEFPDMNYLHKQRRFPSRDNFKQWNYRDVNSEIVTDPGWLKEHGPGIIAKQLPYLTALAEDLCEKI